MIFWLDPASDFSKKSSYYTGFMSLFCMFSVRAEDASVKVKEIPTNQDTTVLVKKVAVSCAPEFEIVSGTAEITGDPAAGVQESYQKWKTACSEWKTETKELNKGNQILELNCNAPTPTKQVNDLQSHHSTGTYKVKVQIKGGTQ
jgi:hypothetical protein